MIDLIESQAEESECRQIEFDKAQTVEVCSYCGCERDGKFSCCGEIHFEPIGDIE